MFLKIFNELKRIKMPAKLTRPENSFNNIYMRYYKKSFLFVKSYIHNEMVAEDIASESLIKLWQWIQDNPVENIEPMLLSILRNKALDYLRHESMKQQVITRISEKQNEELALRLSSLEDCNPNEIFSKEVMDIVQRTLQSLPEQTSRIFTLSRFGNKTNREIAQKLGVDRKCIRNWVFRFNRQQRKLAAGIKLHPKGRPRKDAQPRDIVAEQAYEINRLKMENELLRDFMRSMERK